VVFYDQAGRQLAAFDYSSDEGAHDFSCVAFNPSNDAAVVGAASRLYVYSLNNSSGAWEHVAVKQVCGGGGGAPCYTNPCCSMLLFAPARVSAAPAAD
jgi:hypothetical protein